MFTIDAHLDLAMNALEWNRDLRCDAALINARERARLAQITRTRSHFGELSAGRDA